MQTELEKVKIFCISDLHFGHPTVKAETMYGNYKKYLLDNMELILNSDIFSITGDITDSLLYTNSMEYGFFQKFIMDISRMCNRLNKILIYTYGTPSHEMEQMNNMSKLIRDEYPDLEYYYHTTIEYNYIESLKMSYIAVPDQSAPTDDELYSKVSSLLREKGLRKVDFLFTHTDYEEAVIYPTVGVKSTALWSNLVNYYVINGHIHYHSIRDSVVTVGALEHMVHGDDEIKGGVYITIKNYLKSAKHIPTRHFSIFKTLTATDDNRTSVINKIKSIYKSETNPYFIRVLGELPPEVVRSLSKERPLMTLKVVRPKSNIEKIMKEDVDIKTIREISITPTNIRTLLRQELESFYTKDVEDVLSECLVGLD